MELGTGSMRQAQQSYKEKQKLGLPVTDYEIRVVEYQKLRESIKSRLYRERQGEPEGETSDSAPKRKKRDQKSAVQNVAAESKKAAPAP